MTSKTNAELADAMRKTATVIDAIGAPDAADFLREAESRLRAMPDSATPDERAVACAREIDREADFGGSIKSNTAIEQIATIIARHYAHLSDEVAQLRQAAQWATEEFAAWEKWIGEMLADHKIPFDSHRIGKQVALNTFIHELRAEVLRLRADSARYQWLKKNAGWFCDEEGNHTIEWESASNERDDEAIDIAIKAHANEKSQ